MYTQGAKIVFVRGCAHESVIKSFGALKDMTKMKRKKDTSHTASILPLPVTQSRKFKQVNLTVLRATVLLIS